MARCEGNGYPECDSCLNREHDPFQCDDCDDADLYIPEENDEDWDLKDLKRIRFLEAA